MNPVQSQFIGNHPNNNITDYQKEQTKTNIHKKQSQLKKKLDSNTATKRYQLITSNKTRISQRPNQLLLG